MKGDKKKQAKPGSPPPTYRSPPIPEDAGLPARAIVLLSRHLPIPLLKEDQLDETAYWYLNGAQDAFLYFTSGAKGFMTFRASLPPSPRPQRYLDKYAKYLPQMPESAGRFWARIDSECDGLHTLAQELLPRLVTTHGKSFIILWMFRHTLPTIAAILKSGRAFTYRPELNDMLETYFEHVPAVPAPPGERRDEMISTTFKGFIGWRPPIRQKLSRLKAAPIAYHVYTNMPDVFTDCELCDIGISLGKKSRDVKKTNEERDRLMRTWNDDGMTISQVRKQLLQEHKKRKEDDKEPKDPPLCEEDEAGNPIAPNLPTIRRAISRHRKSNPAT